MTDLHPIPPLPTRLTDRAFPPYSYVPGIFPHPIRAPEGHMHNAVEVEIAAEDAAAVRAAHYWAIDLFNNGYYWEAHEAWEALWHAFGRVGKKADFVKGLIKLAAAGVKGREGNAAGVTRHARRASDLFRGVTEDSEFEWRSEFGLEPERLIEQSETVLALAQNLPSKTTDAVLPMMPFALLVE